MYNQKWLRRKKLVTELREDSFEDDMRPQTSKRNRHKYECTLEDLIVFDEQIRSDPDLWCKIEEISFLANQTSSNIESCAVSGCLILQCCFSNAIRVLRYESLCNYFGCASSDSSGISGRWPGSGTTVSENYVLIFFLGL